MRELIRSVALPALLVLVALVGVALAGDDARLDQAKDLLKKGDEASTRDAGNLLKDVNSAASAEVLLGVLRSTGFGPGLAAGHYRDIIWEGLVGLTDPYARARVELELKKNKDSAWVRAWSAQLLGIYGEPDFAPSLVKALKDKDEFVRAAAAEALGMLRIPAGGKTLEEVEKALEKVASGKDPFGRANGMQALMAQSPETWRNTYLAMLTGKSADKDGGVRCALLGAAKAVAPGELEELSARALADLDWRVRLQAVDNLGGVPSKTSVDRLIEAIDDGRPTVGLRAVTALQKLTGQGHRKAVAWQAWWAANRDTFTFPEGDARDPNAVAEGESTAFYNGLNVTSDHVAFLIDKSAAMGEQLTSRGMSKEAVAQEQLAEVLGMLPEGVVFNVYTYELEVQAFSEKHPVELDPKSVKKALGFVTEQRLRGNKDIWQVLERVVSDPDIDTIYLLSSGEPDTGRYVHWNRVTEHLKDINRFQKVTVHTIAYSNNKWYRDQLEKIAEATGGDFKWFE